MEGIDHHPRIIRKNRGSRITVDDENLISVRSPGKNMEVFIAAGESTVPLDVLLVTGFA